MGRLLDDSLIPFRHICQFYLESLNIISIYLTLMKFQTKVMFVWMWQTTLLHTIWHPSNLHTNMPSSVTTLIMTIIELGWPFTTSSEKKRKTNVGQSDVNLSMLALPSSRIPLMQGGVYCLPCGGWVLRLSDELVDTHLHIIHNFDLPQVVWKEKLTCVGLTKSLFLIERLYMSG
jgi:hypothetical protein